METEEMFTVSITRREFLYLPMEARQRILKRQAEETIPASTVRQRVNAIESVLKDYFANNYQSIVGGEERCQNYIKRLENKDE